MRAGVDANGKIVGIDYATSSIPFYFYGPGDTVMQSLGTALPTGTSPSAYGNNQALSQYQVPDSTWTLECSSIINSGYVKTSFMRSPYTAGGMFASEQMIDELAHAAEIDPVAFRLQNLTTTNSDRWSAVLQAATQASKWQPRVAASNLSNAEAPSAVRASRASPPGTRRGSTAAERCDPGIGGDAPDGADCGRLGGDRRATVLVRPEPREPAAPHGAFLVGL